jgi:hypothetical protein
VCGVETLAAARPHLLLLLRVHVHAPWRRASRRGGSGDGAVETVVETVVVADGGIIGSADGAVETVVETVVVLVPRE